MERVSSKRFWRWDIGMLSIVILVPFLVFATSKYRDGAELREQLRLARSEGMATDAAEFTRLIAKAPTSVNAAPQYRRLRRSFSPYNDTETLLKSVLFRPSLKGMAEAKKLIRDHRSALDIVDVATQLPRCWFDRDWSQGAAVLLPEYADMRQAAKFLALRGTLAAIEGRSSDALTDMARIEKIAQHCREEPLRISAFVAERIDYVRLDCLLYWAHRFKENPSYAAALEAALDRLPTPDLRRELAGDLFEVLSVVDLASTSEGRELFGMAPYDFWSADQFVSSFANKAKVKAELIEAHRKRWAAIQLPSPERRSAFIAAKRSTSSALATVPFASGMTPQSADDPMLYRIERWEAKRMQYRAALAAVRRGPIRKDLLSPYDSKPIKISRLGDEVAVEVSGLQDGNGGPIILQVPPIP